MQAEVQVLIETSWNVKKIDTSAIDAGILVLIETSWNVKQAMEHRCKEMSLPY